MNQINAGDTSHSSICTVLKVDKKGNLISREVFNSPYGDVIRIPDEKLPLIAAIIRAGMRQKGA